MCEQCHQDDWFCKYHKPEPLKQIKTNSFSEKDNALLKLLHEMDKNKVERMKKLSEAIKIRTEQMERYIKLLDKLKEDNLKDIHELETYCNEQNKK